MDLILKRNKGIKTFLKMCNIINGEYKTEEKDVFITLNPGQITLLKYTSTTLCDVEKSFSQYKSLI
jgi:hypothetical protein